MTKNQDSMISYVLKYLSDKEKITEATIQDAVKLFLPIVPLNDSEQTEVIKELQARLQIDIDRGVYITAKDHKPWYADAKANIDPRFWNRYVQYLQDERGWAPKVIAEMDRFSDELMDLLGNPNQNEVFSRRGLCIGNVQSGKTSNYIALMNKAADAGYRVIILLTGTIEKLRQQTQQRVDEGFTGLDSKTLTKDRDNVRVGVGLNDARVSGFAVTSTTSDFRTATAQQIVARLDAIYDPVVFVLKKNKSVLSQLERWLRVYNVPKSKKTIDLPMLLIDDEADNASINTKDKENPTAINAAIRKLLALFSKANYVGFTATPYANIFIDPETDDKMLAEDLFPRDFIYALKTPTNYIGADRIFLEGGDCGFMLHENDDCEAYLPLRHKSGAAPAGKLPESMLEAIAAFFLANAVRDLRGDVKSHRTMMINISRFIAVQDAITSQVDELVRTMQREIRNYYRMGEQAMEYDTFRLLHKTWDKYYAPMESIDFEWPAIQEALHAAVAAVEVRTINGGNASKYLNYDEYDNGLRLIAVGGLSLSRGLTLEGLCISYFYRNSQMYDTLMQMGRWFGYRSHYEDLCQIWMPATSMSWYAYITEATNELLLEVSRMKLLNMTPKDFGLCVRSDQAALMVTARNKMRSAQDYTMTLSLNGRVVETPFLHSSAQVEQANLKATESFLSELQKAYQLEKDDTGLALKTPQFLNVKKDYIIEYLSTYNTHPLNFDFHAEDFVKILREDKGTDLDHWDVMIASGKGEERDLEGIPVRTVQRIFDYKAKQNAYQMSGKGSRLGSRDAGKGGLTRDTVEKIEKALRRIEPEKKNFSQADYFKTGISRNPLLVIYPVQLKAEEGTEKEKLAQKAGAPLIGLSIGIPRVEGQEDKKYNYKINVVKWKELYEVEQGEDLDEQDSTIPEE